MVSSCKMAKSSVDEVGQFWFAVCGQRSKSVQTGEMSKVQPLTRLLNQAFCDDISQILPVIHSKCQGVLQTVWKIDVASYLTNT